MNASVSVAAKHELQELPTLMTGEVMTAWPLEGECLVLNPPGHARWAFDIMRIDSATGRLANGGIWRYLAGRLRPEDFVGWGTPVISPLDGEVSAAHDGEADHHQLMPWRDVPAAFVLRPVRLRGRLEAMAGNHVIIASSQGCVLLAHLRRGSVSVKVGERIHTGEPIGQLGNSGNSVAPHLHFQVMGRPDPLLAPVVPFAVRRYEQWDGSGWRSRDGTRLSGKWIRIRTPLASASNSCSDDSSGLVTRLRG